MSTTIAGQEGLPKWERAKQQIRGHFDGSEREYASFTQCGVVFQQRPDFAITLSQED